VKNAVDIVVSRSTELKLVDQKTGIQTHISLTFKYFVKDGQSVEKGEICKWDPYNRLSF
jgi:DNA-directed RNA polymerase subunit beta'